jgi:hypothetical protein
MSRTTLTEGQSTAPKPFVFVLMPFAEEFDDTYKIGIKEACIKAGAYCERVDEQLFDGTILDRIFNQIAKADVIVAYDRAERKRVLRNRLCPRIRKADHSAY